MSDMRFLFPWDEPDATWFRDFMNEATTEYDWDPTEDGCLDWLKGRTFPDGSTCPGCGKTTKFHRIKGRKCYGCQYCGHQVYPTAGTIFYKSRVPLVTWFTMILTMAVDEEREQTSRAFAERHGITQKTAYYMRKRIHGAWMENDLSLGQSC